jgi:hypothetical protein
LTPTSLGTRQAAELPVDVGPREQQSADLRPLELSGAVILYSDFDGRRLRQRVVQLQ